MLADLLDACRRHYGDRLVALAVYGSVGRGTPRFDSDVDVLIVANGLPAGRFPRVDDFRAVEQALALRFQAARDAGLHPELSPIFKTPAELVRGTPLLLDMTEDARVLHDPDRCLASVLDGLRARLGELGSRRIWRGNAWYDGHRKSVTDPSAFWTTWPATPPAVRTLLYVCRKRPGVVFLCGQKCRHSHDGCYAARRPTQPQPHPACCSDC